MLQPGSELRSRYRIVSFLGRGGMSDVYLAMDTRRHVQVAVKVLREDLAEDPDFVERFHREAEALARLDHPHVVHFYSFERQGAIAFIVMDYVPGTTLRRRLMEAEGPLPLEETTKILHQVGSALQYAHAEGYIHRDIKPGNIMLREDGTALLSDFGIARVAEASTITTAAVGTPAYMSPEQILGRKLDRRTDIYSLGLVLFEMVSGRRPFGGATAGSPSSIEQIREDQVHRTPPDPRSLNPALPATAAAVITRAVAKTPEDRWPDVISMLTAWENAVGVTAAVPGATWAATTSPPVVPPATRTTTPPPVPPQPQPQPQNRRGIGWALIALVGLTVVALLVWQFVLPATLPRSTPVAELPTTPTPTPDEKATTVAMAQQILTETAAAQSTVDALVGKAAAETATIVKSTLAAEVDSTRMAEETATAERQQIASQTAEAISMAATRSAEATQTREAESEATRAAEAATTLTAEANAIPQVVAKSTVNMRAGTDTSFSKVGALSAGQAVKIVGRNQDGSWWQVEQPGGKPAWIINDSKLVSVQGNADAVSIVPTPTQPATTQQPTASSGAVVDFERDLNWERGNQPYGTFDDRAKDLIHGGVYAARLRYDFQAVVDNYVVFMPKPALPIAGRPTGLVAWVYGDGNGHFLNAWLLDAAGEVRSYTFGKVQHVGWQAMTAWLAETGWPNGSISPPDNGQLDYPVKLYAIVLDGVPDGQASQGEIIIDDITATQGTQPIAATPTPAPTPGPTATGSALLLDSAELAGAANVGGVLGLGVLIGVVLVADNPRPWRRLRRRR